MNVASADNRIVIVSAVAGIFAVASLMLGLALIIIRSGLFPAI